MSKVAQQNILDFNQDTYVSFKGYEFNINDQKWILDINKTLCTRQISQNPYPIRILPS